jgi:hypothetical protein
MCRHGDDIVAGEAPEPEEWEQVRAEGVGSENLGSPVGDGIGMCGDRDGCMDVGCVGVASVSPFVHAWALMGTSFGISSKSAYEALSSRKLAPTYARIPSTSASSIGNLA